MEKTDSRKGREVMEDSPGGFIVMKRGKDECKERKGRKEEGVIVTKS